MFFSALSNVNVKFDPRNQTWRKYTIIEAMLIDSWVEQIEKYKFAEPVLDASLETFIVYIAAWEAFVLIMTVYYTRKPFLVALK